VKNLPEKLYRSDKTDVYLRRFRSEGEIFFRPLTYFRSIEDSERRDDHEGKLILNIAGSKGYFNSDGRSDESSIINFIDASMTVQTNSPDHIHICCFSLARKEKFGNVTLEIFDVKGFLAKLEAALNSLKLELQHDRVNYYDPTSKPNSEFPERLWFHKRKFPYADEEEYRVSFRAKRRELYEHFFPNDFGKVSSEIPNYISLKCGSFEDFARLLPV
jgi:hypothetical protein